MDFTGKPIIHEYLMTSTELEILATKAHLVVRMIQDRVGQELFLQVNRRQFKNHQQIVQHNVDVIKHYLFVTLMAVESVEKSLVYVIAYNNHLCHCCMASFY